MSEIKCPDCGKLFSNTLTELVLSSKATVVNLGADGTECPECGRAISISEMGLLSIDAFRAKYTSSTYDSGISDKMEPSSVTWLKSHLPNNISKYFFYLLISCIIIFSVLLTYKVHQANNILAIHSPNNVSTIWLRYRFEMEPSIWYPVIVKNRWVLLGQISIVYILMVLYGISQHILNRFSEDEFMKMLFLAMLAGSIAIFQWMAFPFDWWVARLIGYILVAIVLSFLVFIPLAAFTDSNFPLAERKSVLDCGTK